MANNDNAHLSSEDELFVSNPTEPITYTFESGLSEDEIQDAPAQPAPKPISPAAPNSHQPSKASLDPFSATPEPEPFILPPAPEADDDEPASFLEQAAAALAAVTKAETSTKPKKKRESDTLAKWRGSVEKAAANGVTDYAINGTRPVDIEVALPWIPPSERAAYTHVEVEDWDDGAKHYDTRRRRNKVSGTWLARFHTFLDFATRQAMEAMASVILRRDTLWTLRWKAGGVGTCCWGNEFVCLPAQSFSYSPGYVSKWHLRPI